MLQELTAKEKGDWTPLMAAAESGSVDCFHEVLRAIVERGSEERVRERDEAPFVNAEVDIFVLFVSLLFFFFFFQVFGCGFFCCFSFRLFLCRFLLFLPREGA